MDLRRSAKTVFGWAAGIGDRYVIDLRSRAIVVTFHRIDGSVANDPIGCPPARFERFCRFFRRHFQVVPLSGLLADYAAGREVGGRLAITFDDGYANNFDAAAPVLRKYGLPATFFVTTGWMGTRTVAPWDAELPVRFEWMNWQQLRGLVSQGFEVGSHTHTHIDLATSESAVVREELERSKQTLRHELGIATKLFAYPFGDPGNITDASRRLVREAGFDCCLSCHGGVNDATSDPYRLNRIPIGAWCASPGQFGFELLLAERLIKRAGLARPGAASRPLPGASHRT
jgi:peptidoglycan/xylan/chitin deacetylase (PgdA/CDA1 family)